MSSEELLKRQLARERAARKEAENILEQKALELYRANQSLRNLNENLEHEIEVRTKDLRASELRYRSVILEASDIIYNTDQNGCFTFVNPTGVNAFGYSLEEIIGKPYLDFVLEEYREKVFTYYTTLREDNVTADYYEFPIRSKQGCIHWIGQNVNRINVDDGTFYYTAVARDITQRKETEKELETTRYALSQSEVKYRSVLENLELGLLEVNTEGIIQRAYERFCAMTGYSEEELIGKDAIETFSIQQDVEFLREQTQSRLERESGAYEVQIRRKDGKRIWVLVSGAPFYDHHGRVIGSFGIHFDMTKRKDLEQNLKIARHKAEQAQQAEQEFLANMSHEIRTPLNAIIGMSHLLQDTTLNDKQEEYVEILSHSAALLKGLVSDILDISKIDSGMAESSLEYFDLHSFFGRLIKTFEMRASEKGLLLYTEVPCKEACVVHSDHQWLNQIFINLLSNAIKFTQQGSVTLSIAREKLSNTQSRFTFSVSDTGIGMSAEEVENIFLAFKQANKKVRTNYGGTGLGLSIASRLVSLLGGELKVDSEEKKGSKFSFTLELKTTDKDIEGDTVVEEFSANKLQDKTILVVEDNIMNQKYISALLNQWNISFEIANNGKEAVDNVSKRSSDFNLIFMDLSMPVMDGYQATKEIRELKGAHIPIVALTASTFLSKKEMALQSGMTDFLAKPFTPDELMRILRRYLSSGIVTKNSKASAPLVSSITETKREAVLDFYAGDISAALDMFKTYQSIVNDEIEILQVALKECSSERIRQQLHKINPMFTMVGLPEIAELCQIMERDIPKKNHSEVTHSIQEIIDQVEESHTYISQEIEYFSRSLN